MKNNIDTPELDVATKTETASDLGHKLILWDDDVNDFFKVCSLLILHLKYTTIKAVDKCNEIQEYKKAPVMEGSIKEIEPFFVLFVDNDLQVTIE